ncbi:putative nitronate monooxygenase [Nymphaea thermarum]|nr:putative nitronate monooxygenase [Nymphaea thermarum]
MAVTFGSILGFDNGIMVAPMGADVAGSALVAAVANAGGIGILASPVNSYDVTVNLITATKKLTTKPFGAGILLEFDNTKSIQAIFDEKLACLQVYWGDFPKEMVDEAHKAGSTSNSWKKTMTTRSALNLLQVGSIKDAEKAIAAGVDCIIAQGVEAGGHIIGTVGLIALLPRVVDLVGDRDVTVVAAGSIADARGYVAALALGAKGICMGTRFVATKEAYAHDFYKHQLLQFTEADTDRTDLYSRATWRAYVRCLNTPFHNQWRNAPESVENDDSQPIIGYSIINGGEAVLRRFNGNTPNPTTTGELENMVYYAGQGVGLITEILSAADVISTFVEYAKKIIKDLNDKYVAATTDTTSS